VTKNLDSKQARFHTGQMKKQQAQTEEYSALQGGEKQAFTSTARKGELRRAWSCHSEVPGGRQTI